MDEWEWGSKDEDDWARVRDVNIQRVEKLIDFLIDLKIIKVPDGQFNLGNHLGYDTAGFVDRHWKV